MVPRPSTGEYSDFYASYLDLVVEQPDLLSVMLAQAEHVRQLMIDPGEARAGYRYASDKWSIREVVGHMVDSERIFSYRLLRIARGDQTPMAGFEENDYVAEANFERRTLTSIVSEWTTVRESVIRLMEGVDPELWERRGTANGVPVSARAIAWIIAGHTAHHLDILRERYGLSAA